MFILKSTVNKDFFHHCLQFCYCNALSAACSHDCSLVVLTHSPTFYCLRGELESFVSPLDVNECEETNGGCEALCCNTIGSFYCRCPPGLKLNEDGKTCQGKTFPDSFKSCWPVQSVPWHRAFREPGSFITSSSLLGCFL